MKTALYLRVSTTEQTTDNQLPALEAYAAGKGYGVAAIYRENESAWRNGHQKELARLLSDIHSGSRHYDVLLVWSLDRLSRLGPLAVLTLIDNLKALGCKVESLRDERYVANKLNLSVRTDKLSWQHHKREFQPVLVAFYGVMARLFSSQLSARTKAGMERAKAQGKHVGRPRKG